MKRLLSFTSFPNVLIRYFLDISWLVLQIERLRFFPKATMRCIYYFPLFNLRLHVAEVTAIWGMRNLA
jgi:hypothetical protein